MISLERTRSFAGGEHPYRLSETSPALDAAEEQADVPDGGGARADLGYSELLATPVTLILGEEDLSTVMGNSGVASVQYGFVAVPDPASEVTSTLPSTWLTLTLDSEGETYSYWSLPITPTAEGFYRFYSRATDMVGNQEDNEEDWYEGSFVVDNTPPAVTWTIPISGANLTSPLELQAEVADYAAGSFSVDENDVYFEVDGVRYPATWAAEPWNEGAYEARTFRAYVDVPVSSYSNVTAAAEDKAGNTGTDSNMGFTVTGTTPEDTTPPTMTVALPLPGSFVTHTVTFSGTASDADSGVASVELSLDGGSTWEPTTISGGIWSLIFDGPEEMPMISYPAVVRVTDRAGLTYETAFEFTIDEIAPTGLNPVTFNYPEESHFDSITDLEISWEPAVDTSGVVTTYLTVDQITDTISTEAVGMGMTTAVRSLNASGEWYVHLGAMDAAGNMKAMHFGPWHVGLTDGAFGSREQSIIIDGFIDVAANEWRLDTEYLDDDERTYGSEVTYSPGGQQSFLTTWDADNTFMAWRGAEWALDGELWVYINSTAGGSTTMIEPLASAPSATLPFEADYAIMITDPLTGTLFEFSSEWVTSTLEWEFAQGSSGDTEIRLPLFGTTDQETLAFGLGDDRNVWAIFPATNPLIPVETDPVSGLDALAGVGGWSGYVFPDVTTIVDVATDQPVATAMALNMEAVQAPLAAWGPGSRLQYAIEIINLETISLANEQLVLSATTASILEHVSIDGATCSTTDPWDCVIAELQPGRNLVTLTVDLAAELQELSAVTLEARLTNPNIPPEAITTDSVTYKLDAAAPTVTVATARFVSTGSHSFVGAANDGDGVGVAYVEVRPQYGAWQRADGVEIWTVDLTPLPGLEHGEIWYFDVRAADLNGLVSEPQQITFTVDLQGPTVSLDSPAELSGSINEILGTVTEVPTSSEASMVSVQIDDSPWEEGILFAANHETGEQPFLWTWNAPTEDGVTHTVRVRTEDTIGNIGSMSPEQTILVDNVAPALTVTDVLTEAALQYYAEDAQTGPPFAVGTATDGYELSAVNVFVEKPDGSSYFDTATRMDDNWEFVPTLEDLGRHRFQIRAVDSLGNESVSAMYTVTVRSAPIAGPNSFFTPEDTPITFEPLLDDNELDGDAIQLHAVADPDNGTAVISGTAQVVYTPTLNFNGTEVFTYTVIDEDEYTDTAVITISVLAVNDPPRILGPETITGTMDEDDGVLTFNLTGLDVDEDSLTWQVIGGGGAAAITDLSGTGNADAEITYTPTLDFNGETSFTVRLSDSGYQDEVSVEVTVEPVDDAPRAADDQLVLVGDELSAMHQVDVLDNDQEVDGQTLQLTDLGASSAGSMVMINGDRVSYRPALEVGESETITYEVSDGGLTDTAVIDISAVAGVVVGEPGETIVAENVGISDTVDVTLTLPADGGSSESTVHYVLREIPAPTTTPENYRFANLAFVIDVYLDGELQTEYQLPGPITVQIAYSESDVRWYRLR
jgi:hypothetical protein